MAGNALPVVPNPPTANLGPSLVAYLLGITEISIYFNETINPYKRRDYATLQLPAFNIYPKETSWDHSLGWIKGELVLQLVLPPLFVREQVVDQSTLITDLISLHLSTLDLIQALEPSNPGLTSIGTVAKWDYKKSIGVDEKDKIDAYIVEGSINFEINLLNYYLAIQTGDPYEVASVVIQPT